MFKIVPSIIDTDVLSEYFRGNRKVRAHFEAYIEEHVFINLSVISYYEIMNGLLYKDAKKQLIQFEEFVQVNRIIPLTLRMAKTAARIQADLRKKGTQIGHTDTLIAGIALVSKLQLVTNNVRHFERIKDLRIMNWMK